MTDALYSATGAGLNQSVFKIDYGILQVAFINRHARSHKYAEDNLGGEDGKSLAQLQDEWGARMQENPEDAGESPLELARQTLNGEGDFIAMMTLIKLMLFTVSGVHRELADSCKFLDALTYVVTPADQGGAGELAQTLAAKRLMELPLQDMSWTGFGRIRNARKPEMHQLLEWGLEKFNPSAEEIKAEGLEQDACIYLLSSVGQSVYAAMRLKYDLLNDAQVDAKLANIELPIYWHWGKPLAQTEDMQVVLDCLKLIGNWETFEKHFKFDADHPIMNWRIVLHAVELFGASCFDLQRFLMSRTEGLQVMDQLFPRTVEVINPGPEEWFDRPEANFESYVDLLVETLCKKMNSETVCYFGGYLIETAQKYDLQGLGRWWLRIYDHNGLAALILNARPSVKKVAIRGWLEILSVSVHAGDADVARVASSIAAVVVAAAEDQEG